VLVVVPLLLVLAATPLKNNKENLQGSDLGNLTEMMTVKAPVSHAVVLPDQEAAVAEPAENQIADHRYFIIGGSFKNEENAGNFTTFMKDEGYPARDLGIIKGLHYIAIGSFATLSEARKAHKDYTSKSPDSGVWIYIKK
jgi:cell division septation protein DedD